ncbi:hypothetical protein [Anderseniella sp. Alg231-50]|uniref:hypothetical protein n=1 Tax=Anderseniella sp. Alg231-50 TaxID=1922226 RepID=UPI000D554FB6
MLYLKLTEFHKLRPCTLLLAGFLMIVPTALNTGSTGTQSQSEITDRQKSNTDAVTVVASGNGLKVNTIQVGLSMGVDQVGDGNTRYNVAPRLQSRIRKNPEFAAFAKLLQATSNKKYSPEEIKRLYLDFKNWSLKNNTRSQ